jgi:cell division protein FtsL
MAPSVKHATAPSDTSGFRVFVRASYTTKYNFAVSNYNDVSAPRKAYMRDGFIFLYRSVTAVVWIAAIVCAILAYFTSIFFFITLVLSAIYLLLSAYNAYVYFDNRNLLNSPRLLRAKYAGPDGLDHEWVSVPLNSRSANERLSAVEQSALDEIRREFTGSDKNEIECMVYTKRYEDMYASLPKELVLHIIGFFGAVILGLVMFIL